jgi:hypothetical protein
MHSTKIKTLNIVYIYHLCYKPVKVVCNKSGWHCKNARDKAHCAVQQSVACTL